MMWIFTKHGFLSIVQHKFEPELFQVKARDPEPLQKLFSDYEMIIIDWADYRYRVEVPREEVMKRVSQIVDDVRYTSYKDECEDDLFHRALVRIWNVMYRFQQKRLEK